MVLKCALLTVIVALLVAIGAPSAQGYGYIGAHQAVYWNCWITHAPHKPGLDGVILHCREDIWLCGRDTAIWYHGTIACMPAQRP